MTKQFRSLKNPLTFFIPTSTFPKFPKQTCSVGLLIFTKNTPTVNKMVLQRELGKLENAMLGNFFTKDA